MLDTKYSPTPRQPMCCSTLLPLQQLCLCSGDGNVDEEEFTTYFDSKLPKDSEEFLAIIQQFMEVAKACRSSLPHQLPVSAAVLLNKDGPEHQAQPHTFSSQSALFCPRTYHCCA